MFKTMEKIIKVKNYKSKLSIYRTQTAIGEFKRIFESEISAKLNLKRVSAPLFVEDGSGLNDDLSGYEKPVSFSAGGKNLQISHKKTSSPTTPPCKEYRRSRSRGPNLQTLTASWYSIVNMPTCSMD